MGACDREDTEKMLDFFYESVSSHVINTVSR